MSANRVQARRFAVSLFEKKSALEYSISNGLAVALFFHRFNHGRAVVDHLRVALIERDQPRLGHGFGFSSNKKTTAKPWLSNFEAGFLFHKKKPPD